MRIIGFISNKITIRGTEITIYDYADFNDRILGNKSVIITRPYELIKNERDVSKEAYDKFENRFQMEYYKQPSDIVDIVKRIGIDVLFIEKAGDRSDGLVFDCCKTIVHPVFTTLDKHGDLYLPVSDILNKKCGTNYPVLPPMIRVDNTEKNLRKQLNIPLDALVFGSYSGADEYTNQDVKDCISEIVLSDRYPNIYFIFMNIYRFGPNSSRLKFVPGTTEMKLKKMFINTCDAMIYGRDGGETFGLSCGEFSICDKPVIGKKGLFYNFHETTLGEDYIGFTTKKEVYNILTNWNKYKKEVKNNGYKKYSSEKITALFKHYLEQLF